MKAEPKRPTIAELHAAGKWLISKPELPPIDLRPTSGRCDPDPPRYVS